MSGGRVWKWTVPVDDRSHQVGGGPVALVANQGQDDHVVLWTVENIAACALPREVRVYATGQPVPDGWDHLGSTVAPAGLVWHLFERRAL